MIRPSEHAASGPEPRLTSERHVVVGRLPAQGAVLLPSREDGAKLCTVWGFDSYYRAANERLLRLLGWTEAELSSASYWDFVHPDDQHPLVEALDRIMAMEGWLAGYQIRVLGRNGGWRRMQWDIVADCGTELMFGVGAEIFVGESADGVARAPVGTWVRWGRAGPVTWSDELYAMYGIPVGTPLTDGLIRSRIHPRDCPLVEHVWRARLTDSEAHGVRFRTILPDGTTRHLESTGRVTARGGGRAMTVRGITIDITTGPAADPRPRARAES
jgi:PAS domain-containing protein